MDKWIGSNFTSILFNLEMKTAFWLNLWIECSSNIHRVNVLLSCSGTNLKILENTIKLCIMLCCLWIFYIAPLTIYFTCDIMIKMAAAHWPLPTQKTNYTIARRHALLNRWKQSKPYFLQLINGHKCIKWCYFIRKQQIMK